MLIKKKRVVLGICFCWLLVLIGLRNTKLLKRVGAIPGEIYGVNQSQQFYVGGVYCGQASSVDGKGRKMPSLSHGGHVVEW